MNTTTQQIKKYEECNVCGGYHTDEQNHIDESGGYDYQ